MHTTLIAVQEASSGGAAAVSGSVLGVVVLGLACWYVIKHKNAKVMHMVLAFGLGVLLAGSIFGSLVTTTINTGTATMTQVVTSIR